MDSSRVKSTQKSRRAWSIRPPKMPWRLSRCLPPCMSGGNPARAGDDKTTSRTWIVAACALIDPNDHMCNGPSDCASDYCGGDGTCEPQLVDPEPEHPTPRGAAFRERADGGGA